MERIIKSNFKTIEQLKSSARFMEYVNECIKILQYYFPKAEIQKHYYEGKFNGAQGDKFQYYLDLYLGCNKLEDGSDHIYFRFFQESPYAYAGQFQYQRKNCSDRIWCNSTIEEFERVAQDFAEKQRKR